MIITQILREVCCATYMRAEYTQHKIWVIISIKCLLLIQQEFVIFKCDKSVELSFANTSVFSLRVKEDTLILLITCLEKYARYF